MTKHTLMLVESPHKAKVISSMLPSNYKVMATIGSMFDIENPQTEAEKKKYDFYGVDTTSWDRNLKCSNSKQFALIKNEVKSGKYDTLCVSTDPDRAGSQIGQEVVDALALDLKKQNVKVIRASWQEITPKAVLTGLKNAGLINQQEVDAAVSRSIYDRLFGFAISGNVQKTLRERSAGRVQSPALRLIVDREKERLAFTVANYLQITGDFAVNADNLAAKLVSLGSSKIATGSSFNSDGNVKAGELVLDSNSKDKVQAFLKKCTYQVEDVSTKPYSRRAPEPYTTSTFQQDVGTRLRLSSKQIMSVAQTLYDNSWITYMRTDSPALSNEATTAARNSAVNLFGSSSIPQNANIYKAKGKNAQEGHEGIRPTIDSKGLFHFPQAIKSSLDKIDKNGFAVYQAIFNRTVASQMNPAVGYTTTIRIGSTNTPVPKRAVFATAATTYTDLGWMALTKPLNISDEESNELSAQASIGDSANIEKLLVTEHSTVPPARYTEPSLVQKLSDLEIGRPSTFATIVTVNQTRGYVKKKGQQLYPTWAGMKVAQYLEGKIPGFVDYQATAQMEDELDKIEQGTMAQNLFLKGEWRRIQTDVLTLNQNINWDEVNSLSTVDLHNGFVIRVNSFGAFLEDTNAPFDDKGRRPGAKLSDDENVAEMDFSDLATCEKIYQTAQTGRQSEDNVLGTLTEGHYKNWLVTAKTGKFGPYVQASNPHDSKVKAINQALDKDIDLETLTLSHVESLFSEIKLPRWSPDGKWLVGIGKKGPYVAKKLTKSSKPQFKSLEDKDPKTITFKEAEEIWNES